MAATPEAAASSAAALAAAAPAATSGAVAGSAPSAPACSPSQLAVAAAVISANGGRQLDAELDATVTVTQRLLTSLIERPRVTPQVLAAPPVAFIRDVFVEVAAITGCGRGLFSVEELEHVSTFRESKYAFLTMLCHFVAVAINELELIDRVRAQQIVAGLEPQRTNLLLQGLHKAATCEPCRARWQDAMASARQTWEESTEKAKVEATGLHTGGSCNPEERCPPIGPRRPLGPSSPRRRHHQRYVTAPAQVLVPGACLRVSAPDCLQISAGDGGGSSSSSSAPAHMAAVKPAPLVAPSPMPPESAPSAQVASVLGAVGEPAKAAASSCERNAQNSATVTTGPSSSACAAAIPSRTSEEETWNLHFRAGGFDAEDGRLDRLSRAAAVLQQAAEQLMKVAGEDRHLESKSESDLVRLVLSHVWPDALTPSASCQAAYSPEPRLNGNGCHLKQGRDHASLDSQRPSQGAEDCTSEASWRVCLPKSSNTYYARKAHQAAAEQSVPDGVAENTAELHRLLRSNSSGDELLHAVQQHLTKGPVNMEAKLEDSNVSPLLHVIATEQSPQLVQVLIDFRADPRSSYEGIKPWCDVLPGQTVLEYVVSRKTSTSDKPHDLQKWHIIEETLRDEIDRIRGWKGRHGTRKLTNQSNRSQSSTSFRSSKDVMDALEIVAAIPVKHAGTTDGIDSDKDSSVGSHELQHFTKYRVSGEEAEESFPELLRSLYHARAGFICEHVECHPSERFKLEEKVGEGAFGCVRRATDRETGCERAIKTLPKMLLEDFSLWSEVAIMRQVDHPNIMKLYATFEDKNNVYMVFELLAGGQLFDAICKSGPMPEKVAARMMKQMLSSVCYLHSKYICHRDLKPENFMLARKCRLEDIVIKLVDFGTAKRFDVEDMKTKVCTVHYVAPEVLRTKNVRYTEKCDIWSCGVILFIMLSGTPPFDASNDMEVLKKVKKGKFAFVPASLWSAVSEDAQRLVSAMLTVKVEDRLSANQAVHENWVQKMAPTAPTLSHLGGMVLGKMKRFHESNELIKVALQVVAQQLNDESTLWLRQIFEAFDSDLRGALKVDVVLTELQKMDMPQEKRDELLQVMTEMAGLQGEINYTQFLAANLDQKVYLQEKPIKSAFKLFDVDGDGLIARSDLEVILAASPGREDKDDRINFKKREEIDRILSEADQDNNGYIDYDEFWQMMQITRTQVTSETCTANPTRASFSSILVDAPPMLQGRLFDESMRKPTCKLEMANEHSKRRTSLSLDDETYSTFLHPSGAAPASRRASAKGSSRVEAQRPDGRKATLVKTNTVVIGNIPVDGGASPGTAPGTEVVPSRAAESPCGDNPLREVLTCPKIKLDELTKVLETNGQQFINSSLDPEEGLPTALFVGVAVRSPELVRLLIRHRADVRVRFAGRGPWREAQPGHTAMEMNQAQKGRFVGTPTFDKCEAIQSLLCAEQDRVRGWATGKRASMGSSRFFDDEVPAVSEVAGLEEASLEIREGLNVQRIDAELETELSKITIYGSDAAGVCLHINGFAAEFYKLGANIGDGVFGVVNEATEKASCASRALKTVPKQLLETSNLWHEIEIMRNMDHPNVARLFFTFEDCENICMVMERCAGGEVFDAVEKAGCFSESLSRRVFIQMLLSIAYIHSKGICHRDLKPENFLLAERGLDAGTVCVKLIDFGTAKRFGPGHELKTKICTVHYVAPEILTRSVEIYTEKCDLWSLGVNLFLMLSGGMPFLGESDTAVLKKVRKGKFKFEPEEAWSMIGGCPKDLVAKLLTVDPQTRASAHDALRHSWFKSEEERPSPEVLQRMIGRLIEFRAFNFLKRKCLELVAFHLPVRSLQPCRRLWSQLGAARKASLNIEDLTRFMEEAKNEESPLEESCLALRREIESGGHWGDLCFTSFSAAVLGQEHLVSEESACRAAFRMLDLDGDGRASWLDLATLLQACTGSSSADGGFSAATARACGQLAGRCAELGRSFDEDHDQALSFPEFVKMMRGT